MPPKIAKFFNKMMEKNNFNLVPCIQSYNKKALLIYISLTILETILYCATKEKIFFAKAMIMGYN